MEILTIIDCPFCKGAGCQQCQGKGKAFKPMPLAELLEMIEVSRESPTTEAGIVLKEIFKVGIKE